jgi:hypothetical protein
MSKKSKAEVIINKNLVQVFDKHGDEIQEASFWFYSKNDFNSFYKNIPQYIGNDFIVSDKRKSLTPNM